MSRKLLGYRARAINWHSFCQRALFLFKVCVLPRCLDAYIVLMTSDQKVVVERNQLKDLSDAVFDP